MLRHPVEQESPVQVAEQLPPHVDVLHPVLHPDEQRDEPDPEEHPPEQLAEPEVPEEHAPEQPPPHAPDEPEPLHPPLQLLKQLFPV